MKNLSMMLAIACALFASCSSKELTKDEALKVIKVQKDYPKVIEHDVNIVDQHAAKKLLRVGLEKDGYVIVDKKLKLKDIGKPIVHFTDKAKPFLIPRSPEQWNEDFVNDVTKVKIADEEISEILSVTNNMSSNTAVVQYSTEYKNLTPFAKLSSGSKPKSKEARFVFSGKGWTIEKVESER